MTAMLALIRKDLILFIADRRALLLHLVMPIVLGAFMGYVFGGGGKAQAGKIKIALVAQDQGQIGRNIAAGLKADATLDVVELPQAEAQEQVRKGKLNLAIEIPAGFGDAAGAALFSARGKPEITLYYDPSQGAVLAMVKGILTQHVMQTVSAEMFSGQGGQQLIDTSLQQLEAQAGSDKARPELREFLGSLKKYQTTQTAGSGTARAGGLSMPFSTRELEMSSGQKFNGYGHSFAGMGVQFILMMGIDFGVGILLARRMGLWNRLLAAPITMTTILVARVVSGALIAFGLMCAIFAVAMLVFKIQLANPLGFALVTAAFSLMTACFGLLIAAFGKTPEAARGIAVFATLIMVMLGGAWVPSFLFPQWLQSMTLFIPTRWAIDGVSAMTWRGLGLDAALEATGVLLLFSLAFAVLAFWKFRRDGQLNN